MLVNIVSAGGHQILRAVPEVWEGGGAGGGAEGAVRGAHLPDHPDHLQAALRLLELQAAGQAALDSLQDALRITFITTYVHEWLWKLKLLLKIDIEEY